MCFDEKVCFRRENVFSWFWRKNAVMRFCRKIFFCGFVRKCVLWGKCLFRGFGRKMVFFTVLAGKFFLKFWRKKNFRGRENTVCSFGRKYFFYGFGGKYVLTKNVFLAGKCFSTCWRKNIFSRFWRENVFSRFWRKNVFRGFGGKMLFRGFGRKVCFCGFGGKLCFSVFFFFCDFFGFGGKVYFLGFSVFAVNCFLQIWWESTFLQFWRKSSFLQIWPNCLFYGICILAEKCILWKCVFLRFLVENAFFRFWRKSVFCGIGGKGRFSVLTENVSTKKLDFLVWKEYFDFKMLFFSFIILD